MARIIQNKWPIDLQKSRAIGFGFPLNGDAVFVPTYFTRDQIKANLVNYLLTNKGERVFKPNFGADLRSLLFENMQDISNAELKNTIQDDITTFEFEPVIQAFKEEYKSCTGDEWKPYVAKDKNQLGKNLVTASRLEAMEMLKSKGVVFDIPDAMKEVIA